MAPDFHVNEFKIFVWTLVDSDQAQDGVPPDLVRNHTRLFVLYASYPNVDRWKRLHKTVDTQLTDGEINETFEQLGLTPRIIQLLSDPKCLEQYKKAVSISVSEITPDKLKANG